MSSSSSDPGKFTYAGLFFTTLSLLQLELFLTRIFSVTMWYHFAFMAISLAMFGLAAGAVLVEVIKKREPHETLANSALLFALSSVVCFVVQLYIPADPETRLLPTILAFTIISIPFVFGGVVVCVALTRFPAHTGKLYAADLAGSAAGCALTIPILNHIHAPTAVILNAAIAALAAAAFSFASGGKMRFASGGRMRWIAAACCAMFLAASVVNQSVKLIDIQWIKGGVNKHDGLYEKWNALSRIHVGEFGREPFGWGMSSVYHSKRELQQLYLNIDSGAATVITKFDGNLDTVEHLKYDVTALAHYVRNPTSVLVIGVGGGRDILTSLAFGQRHVTGVEINPDILRMLTERFGEYAGNLQSNPAVTLVNDEARSYIARSPEKYGIIQASLIDTWAATSAGAYVLTENGLYTKEAWTTFLNHLTPDGILTMSRWYFEAQPAETLRLTALATESLLDLGVSDPRQNIIMVRNGGVATILVSKQPFSPADVERVKQVADAKQFKLVLTPQFSERPEFEAIVTPAKYEELIRAYPMNISAPTDDTPFFFHMLRAADLLKSSTYEDMNRYNLKAVRVLGTLLGIVTGLSALAIFLPLAMVRRVRQAQSVRLMIYFAAIGLAFMMVEIGQLERLIVFLGHPIYGLTVVLFVLLIASSLGSLCSHRLGKFIWMLPVVLTLFIVVSPSITHEFVSAATPLRIAASAILLFPCGFFMGMAFPLGIKKAETAHDGAPTAWYWGINGAFSVVSSVLAVVVAVFWGVTVTLLVGLIVYVIALLAAGFMPGLKERVA